MSRGPNKQFDTDAALEQAMLLFWRRGYAGTSMADLQAAMGLGAKSLYDTFGNKRQLYFAALRRYTEAVVDRLFAELHHSKSAMAAANSIVSKTSKLDGGEHKGCLIGVAMAQAQLSEDEELSAFIEAQLQHIEDALFQGFSNAKQTGGLVEGVNPRDLAHLYTAAFQGANLIGRVKKDSAHTKGISRALTALTNKR